jgi:hypothetical protein
MAMASADRGGNEYRLGPANALGPIMGRRIQPAAQRTAGANATRLAYNVGGFVLGDAYEEFRPELGKIRTAIVSHLPWVKKASTCQ